MTYIVFFFFSSRRRHTICALVTGVQTCALPICLNQRIGAKALDRRGAGKDRAGAATLRNEATGKILIRCRRLGFPSDPFAQIPCAPPRKGAIAVDSAKVRQMLVPGLLARGIEE